MLPRSNLRVFQIILLLSLCFLSNSFAQDTVSFRTPAKLYAGAYSIKLMLKKDFTDYDVPVWIKPDQAESTLDASFMKDLGYVDRVMEFEEATISNENLEKKKYKNLMSEWAFVPDFAKSCCYGVIGRDILDDYEIRFDPKSPVHLEWTHLKSKSPIKLTSSFLAKLKETFNLKHADENPFTLNLQEQKLKFEKVERKSWPMLFNFAFIPPARDLKIQSILPLNAAAAKKIGFKVGMVVTQVNDLRVNSLDRWQIEKYFRGEVTPSVKILTKNGHQYVFDFISGIFIEAPEVK